MDLEEVKPLVEQNEATPTGGIKEEETIEVIHEEDSSVGQVNSNDSESMLNMVAHLDENESSRHEMYRRSHFDRAAIKKVDLIPIGSHLFHS